MFLCISVSNKDQILENNKFFSERKFAHKSFLQFLVFRLCFSYSGFYCHCFLIQFFSFYYQSFPAYSMMAALLI